MLFALLILRHCEHSATCFVFGCRMGKQNRLQCQVCDAAAGTTELGAFTFRWLEHHSGPYTAVLCGGSSHKCRQYSRFPAAHNCFRLMAAKLTPP